jgi:plasmid replication initiation protein
MDGATANTKHVELKKHVALIHSHSKISLLQRKIANALLFHSYNELLTKSEHIINIGELTKLIGYDSHDHRKIKDSLIELLATVVEWNIVDGEKIDKEGVWNASSIISDASIQGSVCTYSYSNKMRNLLYHPSIYSRINLLVQSRFQSNYGLALYENCNRYQEVGQTPWFDLKKFRKLMGVEDEKYPIFRDLKSRVVNKAVEEVNKYSGFYIEPKYKKVSRQVIALQFTINKNIEAIKKIPCTDDNHNNLQFILREQFGLSAKQIVEICERYDPEYINEKIQLIKTSSSYMEGKIKNLGNYLLSAIKDDYQGIKSTKEPINEKKKEVKKEDDAYQKFLNQNVFECFERLDKDKKMDIEQGFERYISTKVYYSLFKIEGWDNVLIQEELVKYILSHKNDISNKIEKYEEWIEKQNR